MYNGWYVSPQPQLGIAWNPSKSEGFMGKLLGGNSTVVRAGFGLRRMTEPYQFFWNSASNEGYAFYQSFRPDAAGSGLDAACNGRFLCGQLRSRRPATGAFLREPPDLPGSDSRIAGNILRLLVRGKRPE